MCAWTIPLWPSPRESRADSMLKELTTETPYSFLPTKAISFNWLLLIPILQLKVYPGSNPRLFKTACSHPATSSHTHTTTATGIILADVQTGKQGLHSYSPHRALWTTRGRGSLARVQSFRAFSMHLPPSD